MASQPSLLWDRIIQEDALLPALLSVAEQRNWGQVDAWVDNVTRVVRTLHRSEPQHFPALPDASSPEFATWRKRFIVYRQRQIEKRTDPADTKRKVSQATSDKKRKAARSLSNARSNARHNARHRAAKSAAKSEAERLQQQLSDCANSLSLRLAGSTPSSAAEYLELAKELQRLCAQLATRSGVLAGDDETSASTVARTVSSYNRAACLWNGGDFAASKAVAHCFGTALSRRTRCSRRSLRWPNREI